MATPPTFTVGQVLTAAQMNAVGLWRITTCTVSSAGGTAATASNGVITVGTGNTSVTISNAFSADYDSYKIVFQNGSSSAGANLSFQLSGITGANYQQYGYYGSWGTATLNAYGPAAGTSWSDICPTQSTYSWQMDIHSPFLAAAKYGRSMGWSSVGNHEFSLRCSATTSATGFVIAPLSGTISGGTLRVYGYRN